MIELVLSICLLDDALKCREETLTFADLSLVTCMIGAQPIAAQHMELRPRWYLSRWTCRPAGLHAKA
jgi:hypothetical protein